MNKTIIRKITFSFICLSALAMFAISCRDDNEPANHTLKFEIKGNYTGNLKATITYGSMDNVNAEAEDVEKLTWTKSVDVKGEYAMGIGAMTWDKSGKKGEKITIKMYVDGKEVKSTTATADNDGDIMSNLIQYSGK